VYASYALGIAYNGLFLLYIALFSASLFVLARCLLSIDLRALPAHMRHRIPQRGVGLFMLASAAVTLLVWLAPLLGALAQQEPPPLLDSYTTKITDVLDLGLITPGAFLAGVLLLRGKPSGYLITFTLIVLEALLAPLIAAQTAFQLAAGVSFMPGELIGPIGGFAVISTASIVVMAVLLRGIAERPLGELDR
jgi:hypothetical protein